MGRLFVHPAWGHQRGGGKPDEIVPGTASPHQTDWLRVTEFETLKKESVPLVFHGASGTLSQNICFYTSGKQGLGPFWESENNCSEEALAGSGPRSVALGVPPEPGTASAGQRGGVTHEQGQPGRSCTVRPP